MPTELYSNVTNLSITKQENSTGFPRIKVEGIIGAKPVKFKENEPSEQKQ